MVDNTLSTIAIANGKINVNINNEYINNNMLEKLYNRRPLPSLLLKNYAELKFLLDYYNYLELI